MVKSVIYHIFLLTIYIASGCILFSCKEKEKVPPGILSKDEMVNVLSEVYVAEEKLNYLALPRDSSEKIFKIMEGKILEKTGISDTVFSKSFKYYLNRPTELEQIYAALVDSLQLKEQRLPNHSQ